MINKSILILILLYIHCDAKSQELDNIIMVNGMIENHFHLSSTHEIKQNERAELLNYVNQFADKIEKLDKYYYYQNQGDIGKAELIIKSDSTLAALREFEIAYKYMITKMHQLDILFSPLIQCHDIEYNHVISCSTEQLKNLNSYLNINKEVALKIKQLGVIEMDKTIVYKLIRINP